MTEERITYNIGDNDLHEFFKLHNQLNDTLYKLTNKIALLQILEECCVELEAYKNREYDLLCTAISEAFDISEELDKLSDQCSEQMQNMLKQNRQ